ncbi:MAG: hypothetical protein RL675_1102, partial [Bacteroidota bacterium]
CSFEKDLEDLQIHLSSMSHLVFDETILNRIRDAALLDLALNGGTYGSCLK